MWLLATLPVIQLTSRAAPPEAPESADYERARLQNLKADTQLKELQIQALKDEHALLPLKRREHEVNIENGVLRRNLTLVTAVLIGALLVAGIVLEIADPAALRHSSLDFWRALKVLWPVAAPLTGKG